MESWWRLVVVAGCLVFSSACVDGGGSSQKAASGGDEPAASSEADTQSSAEQAQADPAMADDVEQMTPNEMHHVLEPCSSWIGNASGIVLMVQIDENGNPLSAKIEKKGFVARAFSDCAQRELMANKYKPRGHKATLGIVVQM